MTELTVCDVLDYKHLEMDAPADPATPLDTEQEGCSAACPANPLFLPLCPCLVVSRSELSDRRSSLPPKPSARRGPPS